MFDQILQMVKEHLGNNPQITSSLSPDQQDEVHKEIATHITQGVASQAPQQGGIGGVLDNLKNAATSGSPITGAIEGGLISSLTSKFGLPPSVTGAIAGALPGLLQKFAHRAAGPSDGSITPEGTAKQAAVNMNVSGLSS